MTSKATPIRTGADILILEDSSIQALQLKRLLEKAGYTVQVADNGIEALAQLEGYRPDLIISDVIMPEMDGFEFCKRVKSGENSKTIPIILLTTLSEPDNIVRGLGCGADNFVTKPYDEGVLLSRIQYILVNQQLRMNPMTSVGIEIFFGGKKHFINSDRIQILDLLFSTYEEVFRQKHEVKKINQKLRAALDAVKTLEGILPICAGCKKIRDDQGYWNQVEDYIGKHSTAEFSHGICPECTGELYPEFYKENK